MSFKRNMLNLATKGLWNFACFLLHFYSSWQWTDEICKITHMGYFKPRFIAFHHFVNLEFSSISVLSGKLCSIHLQKWAVSGIIPLLVSHRAGGQIMWGFFCSPYWSVAKKGVVSTLSCHSKCTAQIVKSVSKSHVYPSVSFPILFKSGWDESKENLKQFSLAATSKGLMKWWHTSVVGHFSRC